MNKYLKSSYKFGLVGGLFSVFAFVLLSFLKSDPTNLSLIFGYVISPFALFLAIKFFKEYSNSGLLSFSEGMSVGFVTYCLIAIISGLGVLIYLNLSPELFEEIKNSKLEVLLKNQDTITQEMGLNSYESTLSNVKQMSKMDIAFNEGIWKIIPGLFFTIIISIILRKNTN
jgi:putative flippase GtrA